MSDEQDTTPAKTEIEFAGIRLTGGKIMLLLPILSALGGAAWGGFEFYKDYMDMKEQIQNYVAPDLSAINERITKVEEKVTAAETMVTESNDYVRDIRNDLKSDIQEIEKTVDAAEKRNRELEKDVRGTANELERDVNSRMRAIEKETDTKFKDLEKKVDDKIQKAWENPLAK
jgi:F0F1-type ATP synthase membrane subunit b/b'